MKEFRLVLPWLLGVLGVAGMVRRWLSDRALRLPSEFVAEAAAQCDPPVSVAQWRAVEKVQAALVAGAALRIGGAK